MAEFLLANIFWACLAATAAAGLAFTIVRDGAKLVDHSDAVLLVRREKGVFVDLRGAADFARGRIAQARHIPADEVKQRAAEIERYREKPVVLVCENGMQSKRRTRELAELGFKKVRALRGGMVAWVDAQLPVLKK
ncbi:MAG: rhodanese-like domain-containing protein [Gammaproteobacteria bacterium]